MTQFTMQEAVRRLDGIFKEDVIVCTGVGSHQQIVAREFTWDYPKRRLVTSSGHGTMGFGLPAAIGCALEAPDTPVLLINGDGSMNMDMNHLSTVGELALNNLKIVVLDNSSMGIVRQFEDLSDFVNVATRDRPNPDFAAIAEACGIPGFEVWPDREMKREYDAADKLMRRRLLEDRYPDLIHMHVSDYSVWPILEGGHTSGEMTHGTHPGEYIP